MYTPKEKQSQRERSMVGAANIVVALSSIRPAPLSATSCAELLRKFEHRRGRMDKWWRSGELSKPANRSDREAR